LVRKARIGRSQRRCAERRSNRARCDRTGFATSTGTSRARPEVNPRIERRRPWTICLRAVQEDGVSSCASGVRSDARRGHRFGRLSARFAPISISPGPRRTPASTQLVVTGNTSKRWSERPMSCLWRLHEHCTRCLAFAGCVYTLDRSELGQRHLV